MAGSGLGFELKEIYKERGLKSAVKATLYSTFSIAGPMIIIIVGFLVLFVVMGLQYADFHQRDILMSLILYAFIFSLIVTTPMTAVVSRYIADKFFEGKAEEILSGYYAGLFLNVVIGAVFCVPFIVFAVLQRGISPLAMVLGGCVFMSLVMLFFNMTFVFSLRNFKRVTWAFLTGICVTIALALLLQHVVGVLFLYSMLTGIAVGFNVAAFILYFLVRKTFQRNTGKYGEFYAYLWQFRVLFCANLFYIAGLYVHNFVAWSGSSAAIVAAGAFPMAPSYDVASFLALLVNVSSLVLFTVRVEVKFNDRYQAYCQKVLTGVGSEITKTKKNMFATLAAEIFYIAQFQAIISVVAFLGVMAFGSRFNFGSLTLTIFPLLAAGFFALYIMHFMIVFLCYFKDVKGAFFSALVFLVVTFAVSVFSLRFTPGFYGTGLFLGAFAGWTVAFFRLRYIEKNLNRITFGYGEIIETIRH